jgi:hypothetical protein
VDREDANGKDLTLLDLLQPIPQNWHAPKKKAKKKIAKKKAAKTKAGRKRKAGRRTAGKRT